MSDDHNDQQTPMDDSRGNASVTLRTSEDATQDGMLLDRANRSALDALRIAYTIMTWIMIGLIALFVLSGFQTVNESERAVRLRFGSIDNSNLGAGFQFSYPPPIGELVKIPIGQQALRIDDAFYPRLTERQRAQTPEALGAGGGFASYNPINDGSLITADQNLAHAKWQILYERSDPTQWLRNIDPEKETNIIRLSVESAVVRAMAETKVEDLIKQTSGAEGSIARTAERYAQESLDRLGSGIEIVRLDMIDPGPPLNLYNEFASVNSAQTNAGAKRDLARQEARTVLNRVAGGASSDLIELINRFERATDLGNSDAQDEILASIASVLMGDEVRIEATENESAMFVTEGLASGEVTQLISDAETYRRQVRDEAQGDMTRFYSKLDQYNTNKDVLISREWSDAVSAFLRKDSVQAMFLPLGTDVLELLINRDPQILRDQEQARNRRLLQEANEQRKDLLDQQTTQLRDVGVEVGQ